MMWRNIVLGTVCSVTMAGPLLAGGPARAGGPPPADTLDVNLVPYLWVTGLSGSVSIPDGRTEYYHQSFNDILAHLNASLMMVATLRYNRWVALVDFDYVNLSAKTEADNRFLGQTSLSATNYLGTIVGGYRALDLPTGTIDLMLGTRIMSVNSTINVSGAVLPGFSFGSGDTWADPIVATRVIVPVTPRLSLYGYGDVGGGPNDDATWQIYGGLDYAITQAFTAYVGYRYLSIRHKVDSLNTTENEQGPMIGLGYQF